MSDQLHGVPLLAGVSPEALALLERHAAESAVGAGHVILEEGQPGHRLFLVAEGEVRISKAGARGEFELDRVSEGGWFGEFALLDRSVRSATVTACTPVRLILIPFVAFEILCDERPADYGRVMENLARHLAERLRVADERVVTGR